MPKLKAACLEQLKHPAAGILKSQGVNDYLNPALVVDDLICDIIQKLIRNNLVSSVVGWKLANMVARHLVPTQKLQHDVIK